MSIPVTSESLISETRTMSGLRTNQLFLDQDILQLLNDAQQELDDQLTTANQFYRTSNHDFTLAGGVSGNSEPLPSDFTQDKGVERDPDTEQVRDIHYLSSFAERNRVFQPHYFLQGTDLVIYPARNSAGNYRLIYVPQLLDLELREFDISSGDVIFDVTGRIRFSFANAAFTASDDGKSMTVTFTGGNSVFNGTYVIDEVISSTTAYIATYFDPAAFSNPAAGTVIVQSTLPSYIQTWAMYLKLHASISIRQSRKQSTTDLDPKMQRQIQRIATMTSNRQQGPIQPPLTRGHSIWDTDDV